MEKQSSDKAKLEQIQKIMIMSGGVPTDPPRQMELWRNYSELSPAGKKTLIDNLGQKSPEFIMDFGNKLGDFFKANPSIAGKVNGDPLIDFLTTGGQAPPGQPSKSAEPDMLSQFVTGLRDFFLGKPIDKPEDLAGTSWITRGPDKKFYRLAFDSKGNASALNPNTGEVSQLPKEQVQGMAKGLAMKAGNIKDLKAITAQTEDLYKRKNNIDAILKSTGMSRIYADKPEVLNRVSERYLNDPSLPLDKLQQSAEKRKSVYMQPHNVEARRRQKTYKNMTDPTSFFFKQFGDPQTGELDYNKMNMFLGDSRKGTIRAGTPAQLRYTLATQAYNKLRNAVDPKRFYQDQAFKLMSQSGGEDTVSAFWDNVRKYSTQGKGANAYRMAYQDLHNQYGRDLDMPKDYASALRLHKTNKRLNKDESNIEPRIENTTAAKVPPVEKPLTSAPEVPPVNKNSDADKKLRAYQTRLELTRMLDDPVYTNRKDNIQSQIQGIDRRLNLGGN